jgi:hypothetical protein
MLEHKRIRDRVEFHQDLEELRGRLIEHRIHVLEGPEGELSCRPLSAWRETERALRISEAARKQKVGILRLPQEVLARARQLPAEHAIQISRLPDGQRQAELIGRASALSHRQVRQAVARLNADPDLSVAEALAAVPPEPPLEARVALDAELAELADLCRLLVEIPLLDEERAAVEEGQSAVDRLLERLADVPMPAGPTPRQIASRQNLKLLPVIGASGDAGEAQRGRP